ncbi:MAG: class I SAM-dependent methyltransferase [Acidobacteria bacterium]|nr:class I SAM-dependent methyltransferase [Acidobacteriota bacterium]
MSDEPQGPFGTPHPHNRLIFRILNAEADMTAPFVRGRLVADIGCGGQPGRAFVEGHGGKYVGFDHPEAGERGVRPEVVGVAEALPFRTSVIDTVLLTTVLEHVPRPHAVMQEIARVLKPGGTLILTAPQFWHLHEEPRDYFRFTRFGLALLADEAGLEVMVIKPLGNFWTTFMQELAYWMQERAFRSLPMRAFRRATVEAAQWCGLKLSKINDGGRYSWLHLMIARKPPVMP